jgi:cytochrome P450
MSAAPVVDADLYNDAAVTDSTDLWARIRDAGAAVWLRRHRMYAMGRYDDVRAPLRNDEVFRSGDGVAANPLANALGKDTTLNSDGETHTRRRRVLMRSLGAKALNVVEAPLRAEVELLVEELLGQPCFDAVSDFAGRLPAAVVAQLVGVRRGSDRMLRWAAATFDALGPLNRRGIRSAPTSDRPASRNRAPRGDTALVAKSLQTRPSTEGEGFEPSVRLRAQRFSRTPGNGTELA